MTERLEELVASLEATIVELKAKLLIAESRASKATIRAEAAEAMLSQYKEISSKLRLLS